MGRNDQEDAPIVTRTEEQIAAEWDRMAELRLSQIDSGRDITYKFILLPCILNLIRDCVTDSVLDVGCGVGHLTAHLSVASKSVTGIDISHESIQLARKRFANLCKNVEFLHTSIEEISAQSTAPRFTLAVANMTLISVANLRVVLKSVSTVLTPRSHLVATITHPCFGPVDWGYFDQEWFKYRETMRIEAPFSLALEPETGALTSRVHHSLEGYFSALSDAGLAVDRLIEPVPQGEIQDLYPVSRRNRYPRYLAFRAFKV